MRDQGIGSWTTRRARMTPRTVALVDEGRHTTYEALDERAIALAHGLRARGIGRGDRVAYLGFNGTDFVVTMFATAKLGAVFLPVNTRLAPPEMSYVLGDSGAKLLIHQEAFADAVAAATGDVPLQAECLSGPGDLDRLSGSGPALDEEVTLDDLFMLQYTSGTSGRPKGVMLTHGNVTWNVINVLIDIDLQSDEVLLLVAPLFHTAALNQQLLPMILKGGTSHLEPKFDPARTLQMIQEHKVTQLFGVTSMYIALASEAAFPDTDLRTLRCAMSGGAPIPESLLKTYADRGVSITQAYGLTETSPGVTMLRKAETTRKLGTAGTACFFTDLKVVDPAGGRVTVGEPGEVMVQGPNVSPGYWGNDAATAAAFEDGWVHTGDVATMDDEGYLRIVDRLKDMYISGGENVYPAEVEQAIHEHPDVLECAVIGVPDERWGEVGRAYVTVRAGASLDHEQLVQFLTGRLARYKLPKSTTVVDELPHNASGKLIRSQLKDLI